MWHGTSSFSSSELNLDVQRPFVLIDGVAYPYPLHSRNAVDRAGDVFIKNEDWNQFLLWDDLETALGTINNWRGAHAYPLNAMTVTLKDRAEKISSKALISQRLKRIQAIRAKMLRNIANGGNYGLSTMQDMGGCRVVMPKVNHVEELCALYNKADRRGGDRGAELTKPFDYISRPKEDGYRGIHLVYRYRHQTHRKGGHAAPTLDRSKFDGLKIEIQIRSELQHQWASAVEIAGRFAKQDIKGHGGDAKWRRFFALTSSAIALLEERPPVPKTPSTRDGLIREIKKFSSHIEVLSRKTRIQQMTARMGQDKDTAYILLVNEQTGEVETRPFKKNKMLDAQRAYFETEKTIRNEEGVDAVLVIVGSEEELKLAYPSYYLDARSFVRTIQGFIQ